MFPRGEPTQALQGFEVLERLGAGGAGEVYLARSRRGRLVAIKTLRGASMHEASQLGELAREASMCSRLAHPAIVQLRAFVEEPGFAALVFEYVPGVALARVLRECAVRGVRLPDRAAWHIVERVLAALACAHAQRDERQQPAPIVHRDVSPANVLVAWEGDVKLADFGMATMLGVSPTTRLGLVKGTLGCMAPEQARGERVTERADVYAAALMGVGLATGRSPFARFMGDERELVRAMRAPKLRPLAALRPDLPAALTGALARALEPEASERTITAAELREVIAASVDCDGGASELAALLASWRAALVSALNRIEPGEGASLDLAPRDHPTSRYEDVALAFADEGTDETFSLRESLLPPAIPGVREGSNPRLEVVQDDERPFSPASLSDDALNDAVESSLSPITPAPALAEPTAIDETRTVPTVRPSARTEGADATSPAPPRAASGRASYETQAASDELAPRTSARPRRGPIGRATLATLTALAVAIAIALLLHH